MRAGLADSLRRSVRGEAWHGPALLQALGLFSAAEAGSHPVPGAHSAWEIALHAAGWMQEVARRLRGQEAALPPDGDWPAPPDPPNTDAWAQACRGVDTALDDVFAALEAFSPDRLEEPVGRSDEHDAPLGTGLSYAEMLRGLAQHNAYHAGQVVLLHRALQRPAHADVATAVP